VRSVIIVAALAADGELPPCSRIRQIVETAGTGSTSAICRSAGRGVDCTDGAGFKLAPGYLPGFIGLLVIVVVTQIVTAIGVGAWFPFAAPALWMGLGGVAAASQVSTIQLLLPLPVAALAVLATLRWWRRAEAR
jgi:hypothetical protein